jgi:AraC-like DNA-binding protein
MIKKYTQSCFSVVTTVMLCVFLCLFANAQTANSNHKELYERAFDLSYSNPEEAIKIGKHLLESNSFNPSQNNLYHLLISNAYITKGDYSSAIKYIFTTANNEKLAIGDQVDILMVKAKILSKLYLDNQSKGYLSQAKLLVNSVKNTAEREVIYSKFVLNSLLIDIERQDFSKAKQFLEFESTKEIQSILRNDTVLKQQFNIAKGVLFSRMNELDSATTFLNSSLAFTNRQKFADPVDKIRIIKELGRVLFLQKNHLKAIELLQEALIYSKTVQNFILEKDIYKQLSINYLAINDKVNYQLYNNQFLKLDANLDQVEQESVNAVYNLISKDYEFKVANKIKRANANLLFVSIGCVMVLLLLSGFVLKNYWKRKRLKEIISYLEISKNIFTISTVDKKQNYKKVFIPIETEQAILAKLKRFEQSTKFTNNEMSLAVLASQFDTNTKYLSEIINKHYQDNFNTYINKLRINFIIEKLKTNPNYIHYKISYLAEKSGFSSHSSFATVFKTITGLAPGTFIELLKSDLESEAQKEVMQNV